MMKQLSLRIPSEQELSYRRHLISDEKTMAYNRGYGDNGNGCYYQTMEQVREWYKYWNSGSDNFYAYIETDGIYIGEVNVHYSSPCEKYLTGIVIETDYRGKGYSVLALRLLAEHAFCVMRLTAIYNDFPIDRKAAARAFEKVGFVRISDEYVELTKERFTLL